ncbi:MAG: dihydroxyacetone kinase subunit DhaK [Pseudomonadota bacterium]
MKKILNDPQAYVDEMLDGMIAAHPEIYAQPAPRVVARAGGMRPGKVGIVSGGGSGHLPIFTGYVGSGLLDACAIGDVFASPSAEQMAEAMRQANGGAGVLRLYGNYGGDVMNFDMAGETVELEDDIESSTVLLADDVVSAGPEEREKRRGVGGMVYAFKMAGAKAEQEGADLASVTAVAQRAADACRSVGMALTPCVVPQAGKPTFTLGENEMEMGMGIHGEPGIRREALRPADEIADEMIDLLLADRPIEPGSRVSILVNSLGATPQEELYILFRRVKERLEGAGATLLQPLVGRYATSMEMTGATMTLCHLDQELEALLAAPCHCAFWTVT